MELVDSHGDGGIRPHFVLLPFPAQGHLIPMVDFARLLAKRGIIVTILVTPQNANRFKSVIDHGVDSGQCIRVVHLKLACAEYGLPEGCENIDMLPSPHLFPNIFTAIAMLRDQVEELLQRLLPMPSCLAIDFNFPWEPNRPLTLQVPRLVFHTSNCFSLLHPKMQGIKRRDRSKYWTGFDKESYFKVSDDIPPPLAKLFKDMYANEEAAFGTAANTIEELEPRYIKKYLELRGRKLWCIGPVSLCNKDEGDRGHKASIDLDECLPWLDSHEPGSVIYVCFGSSPNISTLQLIELGLGLESSNYPFVWVIRNASDELKTWLMEVKFEENTRGRGLLIHGWAPQVSILSHSSVGGFITHSGWNSVIEGLTAGIPLVTWPLFADQFCNEELIVNVLKIGIKAGDQEIKNAGVKVERDNVKMAIDMLMDGGEEGRERRERARKLGELAKRAMEEQGSSYNNMTQLIKEVIKQQAKPGDQLICS